MIGDIRVGEYVRAPAGEKVDSLADQAAEIQLQFDMQGCGQSRQCARRRFAGPNLKWFAAQHDLPR